MLAFEFEQSPLAGKAAGVAGELAALPYHAMAGHHDRQWVASDRRADLLGPRPVDLGRQRAVGGGHAVGNARDQPPHRNLKRIAVHAQRQRELRALTGQVLVELTDHLVEAVVALRPEGGRARPVEL